MYSNLHIHSFLNSLRGAGRRLGQGTVRQSKLWSAQLNQQLHHCRDNASQTLRSLRGRDLKDKLRTLLSMFGHFIRETYLDKPARLIRQGFSKRTACFMIAGILPLFMAVAMMLVPAMVFSSPQSRSYYHFARTLAFDPASLLPLMLGLVTLTVMLRMPPRKRVQHGGPSRFA